MATLDVLDYTLRLDEALAPRLRPAERKLAVRDVRHLVEDLAFRFAFLDDRIAPEDIDYARALEALKEPARAADTFAARRPVYRKRIMRKRVTTWTVLAVVALVGAAFASFVSSEESVVLVDKWAEGAARPASESLSRSFEVTPDMKRLQFSGHVIVLEDKTGTRANTITLTLVDPSGTVRHMKEFTNANAVYAKGAIEAPAPGTWEVYVDYRDAAGSSEVTVLGVRDRA